MRDLWESYERVVRGSYQRKRVVMREFWESYDRIMREL
jgi:hypothetical protein